MQEDFVASRISDPFLAEKSFVFLNIFYGELSYDLSAETPQLTLITLIANVGGYLGLFLGVSVFSLFEPIQIFIEILYVKLNSNGISSFV